ncbi:MAG: hypothetical protein KGV56_00095 [Gammaproteobacteria bacterium]|nr:hypothetical protein [Gammaproteobacteria bacterium]
MSKTTTSHVRITDPVLTNLALGYKNAAFVGQNLLPFVTVPKEGVRIPKFGTEAFVVEDDERALFAESNEITPVKVTSETINLVEHDLAHPIDYREGREADFAYEQYALSVVQEKMALNHEKRVVQLVTNESTYGANNKVVLSGTSLFSDKQSDIFGVFDDALDAVFNGCGYGANQAVIPADVWRAIKVHPQITEIMKYRGIKRLTPDDFADMLGKEHGEKLNVHIGRARYKATLADDPAPLWTKDIFLGYAPTGGHSNLYRPAFGYTPRREGGLFVDKYDKEGGKVYNVRCTDIHKEYLLMPEAGYLIKNAIA